MSKNSSRKRGRECRGSQASRSRTVPRGKRAERKAARRRELAGVRHRDGVTWVVRPDWLPDQAALARVFAAAAFSLRDTARVLAQLGAAGVRGSRDVAHYVHDTLTSTERALREQERLGVRP